MAATARDHGDDTDHDHDLILSVPARLKPCSGEMRLVIPPGHSNDLRPRPNTPLIRALARAHDWKQKLFSGEARSIRAIARSEGMSDSYVGYILRLAFLAPDITEAILDGRQPADLELNTLMRSIPHSWPDQRRLYRFGNSA